MIKKNLLGIMIASISVLGCQSSNQKIDADQKLSFEPPANSAQLINRHDRAFISGIVSASENKNVSFIDARRLTLEVYEPVSASEIIKLLRDKGLNITTTLPITGMSYSGYGITDMPMNKALDLIFGSMGLDYQLDNTNELITITPLRPKSWYLNLGNRSTKFSGAGSSRAQGNSEAATGSSGSGTGTGTGVNDSSFMSEDNFWESLNTELTERLKALIDPLGLGSQIVQWETSGEQVLELKIEAPAKLSGSGNSINTSPHTNRQSEVVMGRFSINRDTSTVTVRAPKFVIDELDEYFDYVQGMYNTLIRFEGRLLSISQSSQTSSGLDIAAFASFAKGYGFAVRNNALGGVTVSRPSSAAPVTVSIPGAIAANAIGIVSPDNALQIFNAFLETQGEVKTLQRPSLATTSGIPGSFAKKYITYYNSVSQTTSGGDLGSGSVGVQNKLVPVELGVTMSVNPKYDPRTSMVRAQLNLDQLVLADVIRQSQYLNVGGSAGGIETVEQEIPVISDVSYSGELLLNDGDLIIVGGQMQRDYQSQSSGFMGRQRTGWLRNLLGQDSETDRVSTTYFAITVEIDRK